MPADIGEKLIHNKQSSGMERSYSNDPFQYEGIPCWQGGPEDILNDAFCVQVSLPLLS